MAQTQLNRIYVQSLDATGGSVNSLSLGTKALTTSVFIGGTGTSNNITLNPTGITMAGPTTFTTGLSTTVLTATGNTTLINTSMANLGVTDNASIANASINAMTVVGRTTLNNASVAQLGVTGNASMVSAAINTLSVVGQSTLLNVSSSALTVANQLNVVGNTSLQGTTFTTLLVATNASINGQVNVAGATSVKDLGVAGTANLYGAVNVTGTTQINATGTAGTSIGNTTAGTTINSTLGITGATSITGTLGVTGATTINTTGTDPTTMGSANSATTVGGTLTATGAFTANGQTTLQNASVTGTLAVVGNCSMNALTATGTTLINTTGAATTTIGSATSGTSVGGTLGVAGQTTLQNASITGTLAVVGNCSMNGLRATGAITLNTTGSGTTTIGSTTSATTVGGTLGVTGRTTLQNASITGTLAVTGNCSLNNVSVTGFTATGSSMINTTGSATTTIGSATSATTVGGTLSVTGVMTASNVSTTLFNSTNAYIGTKTLDPTFNYGPSFVDGNTTVSGNEFSVTNANGGYNISNTPIPQEQLYIGAKFLVTITARGTAGTFMYPFDESTNGRIDLTSTMTTYTRLVTITSVPWNTYINFGETGTVTWSTITIETYSLSVSGRMDVSGTLSVGDCLNSRAIPKSYVISSSTVGSTLTNFTKAWMSDTITATSPYTYTSNSVSGGVFLGKIKLNYSVFSGTTYRVCFSVNANTSPLNIIFDVVNTGSSTLYDMGTIDTTKRIYTFYFRATVGGPLHVTIIRTGATAVSITYDFLSIEPFYETTMTSLNVKNQLFVGADTLNNITGDIGGMITFGGVYSDLSNFSRIFTRMYLGGGTAERSELVIFKGNDSTSGNGPDRIRLRSPQIVFDINGEENYDSVNEMLRVDGNGVYMTGGTDRRFRIGGDTGLATTTASILYVRAQEYANTAIDCITCHSRYDSNHIIEFRNNAGGFQGKIRGGGDSSVVYDTSSDRRLKKNIVQMEPMLEKIMSLKPCDYQWISDDSQGRGFIAQEVHQLFPEMRYRHSRCCENLDEPTNCATGEPEYYGLDYGKFTPYIVKAIQEMKTGYDSQLQEVDRQLQAEKQKVITLETTLASVQATLATVLARLAALEQKA